MRFIITFFTASFIQLGAVAYAQHHDVSESLYFAQFLTENGAVNESPPALYRPEFKTSAGLAEAGKAFIIEAQQKFYVVSAQHLLGEAGGMDRDYSGTELQEIFQTATLRPIYQDYETVLSSSLLEIPEANSFSGDDFSKDIFMSSVERPEDAALQMATTKPQPGDAVMLYSTVSGTDEVLHRATLLEMKPKMMRYVFANPSIRMRATSGAPILNSDFQVIGINLAASGENGFVVGYANPYQNIEQQLQLAEEVRAEPDK